MGQIEESEETSRPEKDRNGIDGFDIIFEKPIMFVADKKIIISATLSGPPSNYGVNGKLSVQRNDFVVTFSNAENRIYNGTRSDYGQFHKIYLSPA